MNFKTIWQGKLIYDIADLQSATSGGGKFFSNIAFKMLLIVFSFCKIFNNSVLVAVSCLFVAVTSSEISATQSFDKAQDKFQKFCIERLVNVKKVLDTFLLLRQFELVENRSAKTLELTGFQTPKYTSRNGRMGYFNPPMRSCTIRLGWSDLKFAVPNPKIGVLDLKIGVLNPELQLTEPEQTYNLPRRRSI